MSASCRLIVGLGNPGVRYARTRHNLGFMVVSAFAEKRGWSFKKESRFLGDLASGSFNSENVYLLLPMTYMNLSGNEVRKAVDYYKIPFQESDHFLVVVDDVYTTFGAMRLRSQGSAGGHNGLKSIEQQLGSKMYARLRMGVGPRLPEDFPDGKERLLEDFVLSGFTQEEREDLPSFIEKGIQALESWLNQGFTSALEQISNKL